MKAPVNSPHWPAWSFADAAQKAQQAEGFVASRAAERAYTRQLRSVAGRVQAILATASPKDARKALDDYAAALEPWAAQAARNMVGLADKKNRQAFERAAARQGLDLRSLLHSPGVGEVYQTAIDANVSLIKSIVTHARDEVGRLVTESVVAGTRAEDLAKEIERVGEVTASRARLIAATEVSKAGTALTRARAKDVGSEGYIWRSARDGSTRESHRAMEGRFVPWNKPPILDGMSGHAGEFPRCRCYPEPVLKHGDGTTIGSTLPTRKQEEAAGKKTLFSTWERQPGSPVITLLPEEPLPNAGNPQGVAKKLTTYSLNPNHARGGHKARVFKAALGMGPEHAELLQKQIEALLPHIPPAKVHTDQYGQSFTVFVPVTGPNGRTVDVKTSWIYDRSTDGKSLSLKPRLTTAFVKD